MTDSEFIKKLHDLLHEAGAVISWSCGDGSDTHGIYGESISIARNGKDLISVDGDCLDADDIVRRSHGLSLDFWWSLSKEQRQALRDELA